MQDEVMVDCWIKDNQQYRQTYVSLDKLREIEELLKSLTPSQKKEVVFVIQIAIKGKIFEVDANDILYKVV